MKNPRILFCLLLFWCWSVSAQLAGLRDPDPGQSSQTWIIRDADYSGSELDADIRAENTRILNNVKVGDTLIFQRLYYGPIWNPFRNPENSVLNPFPKPEEKSIRVGRLLGQGGTNKIFELYDDPTRVVRVPSNFYYYETEYFPTPLFHSKWIEGYEILTKFSKTPVPKVYEYKHSLYIIAENVEPEFDLQFFIAHPEKFSEAERNRILSELESFVRLSANVIYVGDMKPTEVVYSKSRKSWVLIDFNHEIVTAKTPALMSQHFLVEVVYTFIFMQSSRYDPQLKKTVEEHYVDWAGEWHEHVAKKLMAALIDERQKIINLNSNLKTNQCSSLFP